MVLEVFFLFWQQFKPKKETVYEFIIEPVHEISNNVVVRPAKPQISLRIRAVWSEPLLVAWVFYDC